jgi:hypothetical protein
MNPAHRQLEHRVRFEWGPTGAAAIAEGADVAVVVDVLSFTTTLCIAVARGITVLPYRWKDDRASAYAADRGATLAVGRLEALSLPPGVGVSLSPARMAQVSGVDRLVLPSPNGSAISFGLADRGCSVVGACLRNRGAVARWLLAHGGPVAVVAGGERWPDDTLRPCGVPAPCSPCCPMKTSHPRRGWPPTPSVRSSRGCTLPCMAAPGVASWLRPASRRTSTWRRSWTRATWCQCCRVEPSGIRLRPDLQCSVRRLRRIVGGGAV